MAFFRFLLQQFLPRKKLCGFDCSTNILLFGDKEASGTQRLWLKWEDNTETLSIFGPLRNIPCSNNNLLLGVRQNSFGDFSSKLGSKFLPMEEFVLASPIEIIRGAELNWAYKALRDVCISLFIIFGCVFLSAAVIGPNKFWTSVLIQ